MIVESFPTVRL